MTIFDPIFQLNHSAMYGIYHLIAFDHTNTIIKCIFCGKMPKIIWLLREVTDLTNFLGCSCKMSVIYSWCVCILLCILHIMYLSKLQKTTHQFLIRIFLGTHWTVGGAAAVRWMDNNDRTKITCQWHSPGILKQHKNCKWSPFTLN